MCHLALAMRIHQLLSLSHHIFTMLMAAFMVLAIAACPKFGGFWLLRETIGWVNRRVNTHF